MNAIVRLIADGLMIPIVAVALFALFFRAPQAQRYQRYTRVFMAGLVPTRVRSISIIPAFRPIMHSLRCFLL